MRITVFGGSAPKPGEPAYQEAYELGKLISTAGHTVLTGGYIGTMEAVSRGASENGGHVIGVTCQQIESWRPVSPNKWVAEEMRFETLRERIFALIDNCDTAVALPGGPGTLTEIGMMWNQMQTSSVPTRPLTLVGEGWYQTFNAFYEYLGEYTHHDTRHLLQFAPDVHEAFKLINGA
jgi:uncharacterized protein (TIGR00730 family)